jgi:hypothetical protein
LIEKIMGQPLAQTHLDVLLQPRLADDEEEQEARDDQECDDLIAECRERSLF